jgi:hypothetical protein
MAARNFFDSKVVVYSDDQPGAREVTTSTY